MSTRSLIAIEREGVVRGVYCHLDGYPNGPYGVGHRLVRHWNDAIKATRLVLCGNLSQLGNTLGACVRQRRLRGTDEDLSGFGFRIPRDAGGDVEAAAMLGLLDEAARWSADYVYLFRETWTYRPAPSPWITADEFRERTAVALAAGCRPEAVS